MLDALPASKNRDIGEPVTVVIGMAHTNTSYTDPAYVGSVAVGRSMLVIIEFQWGCLEL